MQDNTWYDIFKGVILYYTILSLIVYLLVIVELIIKLWFKKKLSNALMKLILMPFLFLVMILLMHFLGAHKIDKETVISTISSTLILSTEIVITFAPLLYLFLDSSKEIGLIFQSHDDRKSSFLKLIIIFFKSTQKVLFSKLDKWANNNSSKNDYDNLGEE